MDDIDKWFAKECRIRSGIGAHTEYWYAGSDEVPNLTKWTIDDPRCRELVREKFELATRYAPNAPGSKWVTTETHEPTVIYDDDGDFQELENPCIYAWGKTIKEAEISCCKAIYEARK